MDETIDDRVRDVGDGLIIAFPLTGESGDTIIGGRSLATVQAYFFRVARANRYYQEYTQIGALNADTNANNGNFAFLGDTGLDTGNDILRVEEDDFHVTHFGYGTLDPNFRVYEAVSPAQGGTHAINRDGQGDFVSVGDDRGFITSRDIDDARDPPAETERISFRNDDDGEFLQFGFRADGQQVADGNTDLLLSGRGYRLLPVRSGEMQDIMLEMALTRPETPEIDTIITQVGGISDYRLGSEEPDEWGNSFARTLTFGLGEGRSGASG